MNRHAFESFLRLVSLRDAIVALSRAIDTLIAHRKRAITL